ncbi:uncharacterized protein LOC109815687 isoform X2 [Cajanus cajan]|uniref:uncharacterized protein LOC109815687 isoform X2 n=1 Tax=Cajanus cajan TaxID=3821 RepID=UPI00098D8BCD|nr:uncharacterized protein LOC109815687 isoform X2 [Cajanus cajan]
MMEVCASASRRKNTVGVKISLLFLFIFHFSSTIYAIRKDISFQIIHSCKTTVQGRYLLSDDNGYVCNAGSVNSRSRCCPQTGEKFSCHGCSLLSQCCNSYEYCVSCCLNPALVICCMLFLFLLFFFSLSLFPFLGHHLIEHSKGLCVHWFNLIGQTSKERVLKMKVSKPATARTYASVFDYCAGRCRHSSESVVHENAYISDFHHCFSLPSNSSSKNGTLIEARLNGIDVVVGRQGESCNSVCKLRGQSCVPNKLVVLNHCDVIQKYMSCKGSCLASVGSDQPAEVVYDAPIHLSPGSCLYTQTQSILSCDGSHQHTRRLCPCA